MYCQYKRVLHFHQLQASICKTFKVIDDRVKYVCKHDNI